jgi:hypothetical protein
MTTKTELLTISTQTYKIQESAQKGREHFCLRITADSKLAVTISYHNFEICVWSIPDTKILRKFPKGINGRIIDIQLLKKDTFL